MAEGFDEESIDEDEAARCEVAFSSVEEDAEVERTGSEDTDFGVLMLNTEPSNGTLSIDTNFDSDGKNLCFFDQNNPAGSRDKAEALVWDAVNNTVIIGGSAFEGDGVEGDGWNMAFCEFNLSGALLRKWSTQAAPGTTQ